MKYNATYKEVVMFVQGCTLIVYMYNHTERDW